MFLVAVVWLVLGASVPGSRRGGVVVVLSLCLL